MLNTPANVEGVFVSLGGNVGDRARYLNRALRKLRRYARIKQRSLLYETEPVCYTNQGWFLNMAVEIETHLSPHALLVALKATEKLLGREQTARYGPRTIDLDILLYGTQVIQTRLLSIPHQKMSDRAFVLIPLAEIAPGVSHPKLNKTILELMRALPANHEIVRLYEHHI